jgi:hypothetical protein
MVRTCSSSDVLSSCMLESTSSSLAGAACIPFHDSWDAPRSSTVLPRMGIPRGGPIAEGVVERMEPA